MAWQLIWFRGQLDRQPDCFINLPDLLDFFGTGSLFIGYGVLCFFGIWFVHAKVFETRGKSLEDIEQTLRDRAGSKN